MMKKPMRGWLVISTPMLVLVLYWSATAQNENWREMKGKPLIKFDWNWASPSVYLRAKLSRQVEAAQKHESAVEEKPDRAFAFDLNRDDRPEYFVPLVCGATGNACGAFLLCRRRGFWGQ